MKIIKNLFEPKRLLLIWQNTNGDGKGQSRARRVVAEIIHRNGNYIFRYLTDSEDYILARQNGFEGYMPFKLGDSEYSSRVLDSFIRRVPPRSREDFNSYLKTHRLPDGFQGSEFSLLGYTGAKLPGDAFELFPDFSEAQAPIDFMLEVAGFRYHGVKLEELVLGDEVSFEFEKTNPEHTEAICIKANGKKIGHVPKPLIPAFSKWLLEHSVKGVIERLNGKPDRPLVYLFIEVN